MSDLCAMSTRQPLVTIERARIEIRHHRILDDVDWRIFPGEHWGLVGDNGSGKSTLLRLLEGRLWPAPGHGRRYYDFGNGRRTDAIEARSRVVTVGPELQNRYARFGWNFRAFDVVRSGVTRSDVPHRGPPADEHAAAAGIVERLGLEPLAAQRFLELSRGQQRRVLIARAIAFRPALLLLDEPASGLDAVARRELDRLLSAVAREATVIVTGHEPGDLPAFVSRCARIRHGRLEIEPAGADERTRSARPPEVSLNGRIGAGPGDASTVTDAARSAPTAAGPAAAGRADPMRASGRDAAGELQIALDSASVYYDGKAVLRDVDWEIRAGEHWLVSGPNGSGKSTLLRLLHGQVRPAVGGSIRWPGLGDPADVWTLRRQVGLVSAELLAAYRYPASVRECIASGVDSSFGLVRTPTAPELERVDALIGRFGLTRLAGRPLQSLSYGQLHRTMIARTLVNGPRIVLLDEPWEGLDRPTRDLVAGALLETAATGLTIVCASHIDGPPLGFDRWLGLDGGAVSRARDSV